jgi:hypothetical protein
VIPAVQEPSRATHSARGNRPRRADLSRQP